MSSKNYYDVKKLDKDLQKLVGSVEQAATRAVATITQQSAFTMSFDEAEAVPYTTNENGNIVISVRNTDPATLDRIITQMSASASTELQQHFINNMKGVIK